MPSKRKHIRLWQSGLAVPFQQKRYQWGCIGVGIQFKKLEKLVRYLDKRYSHPSRHPLRTVCWSLCGLGMIFRATIFRAETKSWTYPFQVAFGPFILTALLILGWVLVIIRIPMDINTVIQIILGGHLLICWLGLGYRMHRLCAPKGDRTIEAWSWRAMVQRHKALSCEKIKVEYCGWVRKSVSDPV